MNSNHVRTAAFALALALTRGVCAAQGADDCTSAQPISGPGVFDFLLVGATTDGAPSSACQFLGQSQIGSDVWFAWTATTNGVVTLETCGLTIVDTKIAVYADATCGSSDPVACNDDACGLQSALAFTAAAQQTYLLRIGTFPGAFAGAGQILVTEIGSGGSDDCAAADPITGTGTFSFDCAAATTDGRADPLCDVGGQSQIEGDVWFLWTAPADDSFIVSLCGSTDADTRLAVYAGASCSSSPLLACDDDACGLQSEVDLLAVAGGEYLIRIGASPGAPGGSGSFTITAGSVGGPCGNAPLGPDLIVGDLTTVQNYGGTGGTSSFSIGTTICNTGQAEADWIQSNSLHPVWSQSIYRLMDGRFEQIGLGWVTHGVSALQGSLCCDCVPAANGARLGVGCSTESSAPLNGAQTILGPRSDVDAFTGAFPYPYSLGFGQSGNAAYKRLQVPSVHLDPMTNPGALYFGESQVVAADDAGAANSQNNVSHRQMLVLGRLGTGFSMVMTSATVQTEPAIRAWKTIDPTVTLSEAQVPGEGRFLVASNAYDNGDGTWAYEYAVFNLDSDLSGQALSVDLGINVSVADVGMSCPRYHSGEAVTDAPWTSSLAGGELTWATDPFLQDPDANALRWGTMYSFWFTANTAPETRSATIGLFKAGGNGPVSAQVVGPMDGPSGAVVSNYCSSNANSTGASAEVTAGRIDLVARTMDLTASALPANTFGLFINSLGQDFVPNPAGSAGDLCLDQPIGRHNLQVGGSGPSGLITISVDLDRVPQSSGAVAVLAGETWNWQAWFRDVAGGSITSNFTNGVSVQFP
ncbi:MAG: hypothetical protein VX460_00435 [Planctomycetota bacterium]|nr:hypothetical protein [Planctomycetota bacterium]